MNKNRESMRDRMQAAAYFLLKRFRKSHNWEDRRAAIRLLNELAT